MPSFLAPALADLVAITVIVAIYVRRHERRDLLLSYVALNIGILTVTAALADASVGASLGLGLFGILSIIRLRSDSITQEEIAYYFIALALGLVAGLHPGTFYLTPMVCGVLVLVMYVADHPALLARSRRQLVTIDAAIADERELRTELEQRLGADVRHFIVQELDFVRDLTIVDVRFREGARPCRPSPGRHALSQVQTSSLDGFVTPVSEHNGSHVAVSNGQYASTSLRDPQSSSG
ncbi:DUF4956 domain-containing protein [Humibacillus xanthopallidus]|uniref:Uncharacterized protein DUF4956 n=1 Tax=Humibacillus xanthopallidus TaxID=412689 RepID=A0A543I1S0_9MICO|nr:DUF4956 domain-containing protein [Humibacillus xanthopallidus]TQM64539.1 uncharacterized protein DUF4956 [Humibacillus xanthopallidus]